MIYLQYIFLTLVSLPLTLIALLLAPLLPFLADKDGWLPDWLWWLQTPDNSIAGDPSFQAINGVGYLAQVKWLLRNPAYAFGVQYITGDAVTSISGDPTIKDNDGAKEGWCFVKVGDLFQFTHVKQIFSTQRCLYVNFGWNIRGYVDPNVTNPLTYEATFVFSPRISGFRP